MEPEEWDPALGQGLGGAPGEGIFASQARPAFCQVYKVATEGGYGSGHPGLVETHQPALNARWAEPTPGAGITNCLFFKDRPHLAQLTVQNPS